MTITHKFEGRKWGFTFVIKWEYYSWKYNNWNDQLNNNKLGTENEDSCHTTDVGRKYSDKGMERKRSGKCEKEHVCLIRITKREEKKNTNNIWRDNG